MAAFLQAPLAFAMALAAATKGQEARESIAQLEKISKLPFVPMEALREMPKVAEIQQLEIAAVLHAGKGRFEEAIQNAKKATELEASLPPPAGPPVLLKPSYELYGEVLLRAGRFDEAHQQFMTSLTRHPDRGRSLLGGARAAARRGDAEGAASLYARFLDQWKNGSQQSAELAEARKHSKAARK
jgi:tetratricopeptide (TPR) repeat protein